LIAEHDDFLFNGHAPVRVAVEADYLPRAFEVTTEAVRVLAHEVCTPIKARGNKHSRVPLSKDIAQLYLHGLEGRWRLRPLHGIATAPILDADGGIHVVEGYDAATGLWCHNIPDIAILNAPTAEYAADALYRLRHFFRTFPFADSARVFDSALGAEVIDLTKAAGLDESNYIVALLTAVCRQSLETAPGLLCSGPAFSGAGTGKGLLIKAACIIASGVRPSAFTSGHNKEEFDKRLTAALIEARPAVYLDNFNSKELKSDVLNSALTENPAEVRPMGQTKMVPLHTHTFVGINGNAVEIAEDMARRLLNVRVDAKTEDPELRTFAPGFLDHVFTSRNALLTNALTIWRWGRQNKLKAGKTLGSFETWGQWCRDPLLALGARDPVERVTEIKAADPQRRALTAVFDVWWEKHADATVKAKDLDPAVIEIIDPKASWKKDGNLQFSRQRVARFLATHTDTRVGGYLLEQKKDDTLTRPLAYYKLHQETVAKAKY
jgi:hypothetical protein